MTLEAPLTLAAEEGRAAPVDLRAKAASRDRAEALAPEGSVVVEPQAPEEHLAEARADRPGVQAVDPVGRARRPERVEQSGVAESAERSAELVLAVPAVGPTTTALPA